MKRQSPIQGLLSTLFESLPNMMLLSKASLWLESTDRYCRCRAGAWNDNTSVQSQWRTLLEILFQLWIHGQVRFPFISQYLNYIMFWARKVLVHTVQRPLFWSMFEQSTVYKRRTWHEVWTAQEFAPSCSWEASSCKHAFVHEEGSLEYPEILQVWFKASGRGIPNSSESEPVMLSSP